MEEGRRISKALNVMSNTIESELEKGGDNEARELSQIHHETLSLSPPVPQINQLSMAVLLKLPSRKKMKVLLSLRQ